jgi:hypothetical protein
MISTQEAKTNRLVPRFDRTGFPVHLRRMTEDEIGRPHGRHRVKNLVQGQMDARVQPLYDIVQVAINTATVAATFFTIPWGQSFTPTGGAATIKTYYHTNLKASGALPSPEKFLVKNICLMNRPDMSVADTNALVGQSLVKFNTLGKDFWIGHGQKLPGGAGAFASGAATFTSPQAQISTANGWPSAQNACPITDPVPDIPGYPPITPITGVLLEQAQPFELTLDPTLTGATVYTTANSTTTVPGYVSVGWIAWIVFEGIRLVAIV